MGGDNAPEAIVEAVLKAKDEMPETSFFCPVPQACFSTLRSVLLLSYHTLHSKLYNPCESPRCDGSKPSACCFPQFAVHWAAALAPGCCEQQLLFTRNGSVWLNGYVYSYRITEKCEIHMSKI